jgi:hypothetical protein
MIVTNHHNLPSAIVAAVRNDPYPTKDTGDISVTRLIQPPQITALQWLHRDKLTEDASERIWSLLGQAVHAILERTDPDAEVEKRLWAEVRGWWLSGQADRIVQSERDPSKVDIEDYKVTSVYAIKDGLKEDWYLQLWSLQWLAERNGYDVDQLRITAILRDWSKHAAKRDPDYPQQPVAQLTALPPSPGFMDGWISRQVLIQQEARIEAEHGGFLPECSADQRWQRPAVYAVKRPGRKSAVRLYDNEDDALAHTAEIRGGYVEHRPGEAVRCEHYCPVRDFCRQYAPAA